MFIDDAVGGGGTLDCHQPDGMKLPKNDPVPGDTPVRAGEVRIPVLWAAPSTDVGGVVVVRLWRCGADGEAKGWERTVGECGELVHITDTLTHARHNKTQLAFHTLST